MQFIIPGNPTPQKRSRTYVKNGCVMHYNSQRKEEKSLQLVIREQLNESHTPFPIDQPLKLIIRWCIAMPKSWSKKKKESLNGTLHTNKPDCSNMQKFYEDALNKILWEDDCSIAQTATEKIWAYLPMTILKVVPVENYVRIIT